LKLNIIDLFTGNCTSKLTLLSRPDLHKFLMESKDVIFYCERKFNKGKVVESLCIKIFKEKNNITFREFYILLLSLNDHKKSLDGVLTEYLISNTTCTQWNRMR
jgi:hypothetical protein